MAQQNILVIELGPMNDFIYSLGAMAAIRKAHAGDKIALLTTEAFAEMAQDCGYFDEIFVDDQPKIFDILGRLKLRSVLNAAQFSRVYDLQNNRRTQLYSKLFSPKPEWIGTIQNEEQNHAAPLWAPMQLFLGHREALARCGVQDVELDRLDWLQSDISRFALKKPYVLIIPGYPIGQPQKGEGLASFRIIIGKLILQGYCPVIIGSKEDKDANEKLARGFEGIIDLTGKVGVSDIPSLAKGAVVSIGHDTSLMHMVALSGCPAIILFYDQKKAVFAYDSPQKIGMPSLKFMNLREVSAQTVWSRLQEILSARIIHSDIQSYSEHADG